jgi:esterase/lipase superfamily enzyme
LHTAATLPTDRCHLNDAAVRINRHHRYDTTIREEYVVERTVSVHQDLPALAWNAFKLRHKPLEIAGWQSKQKPIAGPI